MSKSSNRTPQVLIVVTIAINSLGIGLALPVMPELLQQVSRADVSQAAAIGGQLSLVFAAMQVLFGPILGSLSDQFGRRPVIILSLVANAVDYAILATSNALWMFFVVRMFSGIASATFSVANAMLADMSPPEQRASQFGLTGAAFGIGFVLGPVFGGVLAELGPRAPFIAAGILCAVAAILCWLWLPESLANQNRRRIRIADCIPLASFLKLKHRLEIAPLVLVTFFDAVSGIVFPAVWAYFAIAQFGWDPFMIGLSLAVHGICMAIVQGGLIRVMVNRLGERSTAICGLLCGLTGFVVLTNLQTGIIAFLLTPLFAIRAVANTAIRALLSKGMSESEQGQLQGILAGVNGVSTLVGFPLLTQVFALANRPGATNSWPGAPFAVSAIFSVTALVVFVISLQRGSSKIEKSQLTSKVTLGTTPNFRAE